MLTPMELLERAGKLLMQQTIDMALAGDVTALRLCVERLWPPRRGRAITLGEMKIETTQDAHKASNAILHACTTGKLPPPRGPRTPRSCARACANR